MPPSVSSHDIPLLYMTFDRYFAQSEMDVEYPHVTDEVCRLFIARNHCVMCTHLRTSWRNGTVVILLRVAVSGAFEPARPGLGYR